MMKTISARTKAVMVVRFIRLWQYADLRMCARTMTIIRQRVIVIAVMNTAERIGF